MKRILIIGTGSIGERHLRCFQNTRRAEVAACEPNEELGRSVAGRYGCPWYGSLDEALGAASFDAAVICTPAQTHIAIATQCVRRGLHLLIEKPLAVTLEGIPELQALVGERNAIVRVAYIHRSLAPVRKVKDLLESGVIGEPKQLVIVTGQHFPTFRPAYRSIYYTRHESGGGAIQDALTHSLHGAEWLLGPIQSVFADAAHQVLEGVEVEDTVHLLARFGGAGNGVLGSFSLNQFQPPNEAYLTLNGTEGSLRSESHRFRVGVQRYGDEDWNWHQLPPEDRDGPFLRQAEAFLNALDGCPEDLATLGDGLQTLRVNIAALESSRTRREIDL